VPASALSATIAALAVTWVFGLAPKTIDLSSKLLDFSAKFVFVPFALGRVPRVRTFAELSPQLLYFLDKCCYNFT
jgi:hypothetical protein